MKLCVLRVEALKLSLRDEVGKVGGDFQRSVATSCEEKQKESVSVSPHVVGKKNPFTYRRFAPSDANRQRPYQVLSSSGCDMIERPNSRVETSLSSFTWRTSSCSPYGFVSAGSGVMARKKYH